VQLVHPTTQYLFRFGEKLVIFVQAGNNCPPPVQVLILAWHTLSEWLSRAFAGSSRRG
jgi:hypothetical protein